MTERQRHIRRVITICTFMLLCTNLVISLSGARASDPVIPAQSSVLSPQSFPLWHAPDANRLKFGIAGHMWWLDAHLDEFMAYYHQLGITNVRLSLDWKTFEPQPGQYDFDQFDRVLN
ncbi:MAG: beta-galactosidase, partial [Thermomicrobia bacterium]|nr:beta-galactosidase [Thermomicrobia bacterium]